MGTQKVVVKLHPYRVGRKDFATHVGNAEWEDGSLARMKPPRIKLAESCGGTLIRVGINNLECNKCHLMMIPRPKALSDDEFEALWAWDLLRVLGPVPEEFKLSTLAPHTVEMGQQGEDVIYWPNWAKTDDMLIVTGHTCRHFKDLMPAIYRNEIATHSIMSSRFAAIAQNATSGMSSLYWKLE